MTMHLRGLILLLSLSFVSDVQAGLAPHNVLVVVNEDSWASKAIANEYIRLRKIPPSNVVYLHDLPATPIMTIEEFRELILKPLITKISERGIENQIECVTYSADFPWIINLRGDLAEIDGPEPPKYLTPFGSLTGMTYLLEFVFRKDVNYLQLSSNGYFRKRVQAGGPFVPSESEAVQFREAVKMMEQKRWDEAQAIFERLLRLHDHVGLIWYNYACCLCQNEKYLEALKALESALANGFLAAERAEKDEDLRPLRSTEGFRDLMDKMKNPVFETEDAYAFSHRSAFEHPFTKRPVHYLMSTMLGVTQGRGNSISEIMTCLRRSVQADESIPAASFYFSKTDDIRSKTREAWFEAAVAKLREDGRHALIIKDPLPKFRRDIGGLMTGVPGFDWPKSQCVLQPGAICEHLTSFGAVMYDDASQTPISEWIRHGASGTSGTVFEPYALQPKFPTAFLHVYYSRGYSLAESFYLSVQSPYQLLIVGDPLCQPWAVEPEFNVEFEAGREIGSSVPLLTQNLDPINRFSIIVDGVEQSSSIPGVRDFLRINTLSDGAHELNVVATGKPQPQTQRVKRFPFTINRYGKKIDVTVKSSENGDCCSLGQTVTIAASCDGAEKIDIMQNMKLLGTIDGAQGELVIPANELGLGEPMIYGLGTGDGWTQRSESMVVKVAPPALRKAARPSRSLPLKPGVLLTTSVGKQELEEIRKSDWMKSASLKPGEEFELSGYHDVVAEDLYQLQLAGNVDVEMTLDGVPVELPDREENASRLVPLSLGKGLHLISFKGKMVEDGELQIFFGSQGRPVMGKKLFKIRK